MSKKVTVIMPAIGHDKLGRAVASVASQTYKDLELLVVVDGPQFWQKVFQGIIEQYSKRPGMVRMTAAPDNTGANGMYGHRIYAAYPHLVNSDYIAFLDEDNWWDANHVESLVSLIEEQSLDWAHSLRKVYENDVYVADDNCEAIGRWPIAWSEPGKEQYLVDSSTYMFTQKYIITNASLWHSGWGADRLYFMSTMNNGARYSTTGLHTLNYGLPDMDKAYGGQRDIFKIHNQKMLDKHGGKYPWQS